MAQDTVRIHLDAGDALAFPADLAFVGAAPGLLRRIEHESGARFERMQYPGWLLRKSPHLDGLRTARHLVARDFRWKAVVALSLRPSRRWRNSFEREAIEAMQVAVHMLHRPASVLIVPWQREPERKVAAHVLFFAWCVARMQATGAPRHFPQDIRIACADGIDLLRELIETSAGRDELDAFAADTVYYAHPWREPKPRFEIIGG